MNAIACCTIRTIPTTASLGLSTRQLKIERRRHQDLSLSHRPESPIPPALIRAAEQGKQVTALIELKARFDEEHNIEWARKLDQAGVHVVYGIIGLKTHGKLTLVIRREGETLKRYVHIASGNYNPTTSCTYTDLGMFTVDDEIGRDATELFNYLTGFSEQSDYRKLMVAPVDLREKLNALFDREIEHQRAGRPAHIIAKFNRLADLQIIEKLYEVSRAGVQVDLIVRGICMLRPGIPGLVGKHPRAQCRGSFPRTQPCVLVFKRRRR